MVDFLGGCGDSLSGDSLDTHLEGAHYTGRPLLYATLFLHTSKGSHLPGIELRLAR